MAYVDGFVIVIPKRLLGDYRRMYGGFKVIVEA
jgi:uncharacterized protein YbaA (DUF1428 family)